MSHPVILVAVDIPHADDICRGAAPVAEAMHARVILLHVLKHREPVHRSRLSDIEADAARQAAQQALSPLTAIFEQRGLSCTLRLISGEVVHSIHDAAQDAEAIMIVIGSDISSNVLRSLQGSFTRSVLRGARSPVLVIPTKEAQID